MTRRSLWSTCTIVCSLALAGVFAGPTRAQEGPPPHERPGGGASTTGVSLDAFELVQTHAAAILEAAFIGYPRAAPPRITGVREAADGTVSVVVSLVGAFDGLVWDQRIVRLSPEGEVLDVTTGFVPFAVLEAVQDHAAAISEHAFSEESRSEALTIVGVSLPARLNVTPAAYRVRVQRVGADGRVEERIVSVNAEGRVVPHPQPRDR